MPLLFIIFEILNRSKFDDFLTIYELIKLANMDEQAVPIPYWKEIIPSYSKKYFNEVEYEEPEYDKSKMNFDHIINHLQRDLEVIYLDCVEFEPGKGKLELVPEAFPYGGLTNLIQFMNTFECRAIQADFGNDIQTIKWETETSFDLSTSIPQ